MTPDPTILTRLSELSDLYRECLSVTEMMLTEESLKDIDRLEELLQQRAQIIKRIQTRETVFQNAISQRDNYPEFNRILEIVGDVGDRLLKADQRLGSELKDIFNKSGQELDRAAKGRAALKAYRPFRGGAARIIDQRR